MNGILPLYKPTGMTSHDCVAKLRRLTGERKIGHTGTLDPGAEGVLPICFGKATKVVSYMTEDTKRYEAEIVLGIATETEDRFGKIIEEKKVDAVPAPERIREVLHQWTGSIKQVPPMFSAVKVKGKRLYEYAREGIKVERPTRQVTIYELRMIESAHKVSGTSTAFRIGVHCSKGTYIRTLGVDIGKSLGCPAHVSWLKRTASGAFGVNDCFDFAEVEALIHNKQLEDLLLPLDYALQDLPKWSVDQETEQRINNGAVLEVPCGMQKQRFTVYNEKGCLLAVYRLHPNKPGLIKPEKVFHF